MNKFKIPELGAVYINKAKITKSRKDWTSILYITLEEAANSYIYEINENGFIRESTIIGAHRNLLFRYRTIYSNWWWNEKLALKEQES